MNVAVNWDRIVLVIFVEHYDVVSQTHVQRNDQKMVCIVFVHAQDLQVLLPAWTGIAVEIVGVKGRSLLEEVLLRDEELIRA